MRIRPVHFVDPSNRYISDGNVLVLPIYVISLENAVERRRSIDQQFRVRGVQFEYFDAVDGATLSNSAAAKVNLDQFLLNTGRIPSDGEIACFLSHRALWQLCVKRGKALMILEDDCTLRETFFDAVFTVESCVDDLGIIRLQDESKPCKYPLFATAGATFWRYTKTPFGACGYVLSPAAARKLLDASQTIMAPVDGFLKMPWLFDQAIHAMTPYAIELGPLSHDSQIAGRAPETCNLKVVLVRPLYKGVNWVKRLVFNRRQHRKAEERLSRNIGLS